MVRYSLLYSSFIRSMPVLSRRTKLKLAPQGFRLPAGRDLRAFLTGDLGGVTRQLV